MERTIWVHGFPSTSHTEEVKSFLEQYTGDGTVYAMKIRPSKGGGLRCYAIVQFTTAKEANLIIKLAALGLNYETSCLKAKQVEADIIPKPRAYLHRLSNVQLCFGCQISNEKFTVLWGETDVSVNIGINMRKLHFFLSYKSKDYKFELSYENIWQIELHHPRGSAAKYLLFQLYGAPRLFRKDSPSKEDVFESPFFNYFRDGHDYQWVRTTDFTPFCSIGQSSAVCLVLDHDVELPNLKENFAYYKQNNEQFIVEVGESYSCHSNLVPIVGPRPSIELPFEVIFKLNLLVQHGCLPGPALDHNFYCLVDPKRINFAFVEHALDKLYHLKECCYEPSSWLIEQYTKYRKHPPKSPSISLDSGLVYVRRVQITPCKVYFSGPEVNMSNRVLRKYPGDIDNFLRVSFVDEEWDKLRSVDLSPRASLANEDRRTDVYKRILSILRNGLEIGGKQFEFLAFSSSQLRENSLWMFSSRTELTANDIRNRMGDFSRIKNVAKYAARLGQSFSSSTESLNVERHEMEVMPDIEVKHDGINYVFSDGIGKISIDFSKKVAAKCGIEGFTPSAFQIRYGGYKGVVAVDPNLSLKLSLRKSMCKFESESTKLDILAFTKYQPCFLNRQLITLLSTLGVKDSVFVTKQREAVDQLNAILTDPLRAEEALQLMSPGENTEILKEMLSCGYKPNVEPFLSMMLQNFRASKLLELRTKSRIYVPDGRAMMGCLDETRTLEYGQVFVQFSDARHLKSYSNNIGREASKKFIVERRVVVAKNPCLHPGDVRVLMAINVSTLHHLVDCVVFPQKGHRPHPNECSGSDLDGDIYFVCWDDNLIPPQQIKPMDYTPAPSIELDRDVTMEDVHEYFTNYIVNDSLGIIANAHTVFADREAFKARSSPCIELAKLFSIAVDFPKTGVPAIIPSRLHVKEYPDFMEKPDKPTYESPNVVGKLFREVKDIAPSSSPVSSFTREAAMRCYDADMEVDGFENYLEDAFYHKTNYDYKLGNLMDYYGIKTESEILSGSIMKMAKSFNRRRDAEAINVAVRSLRKEARNWFNEKDSGADSESDNVYAKASAWYHVTYHYTYWGQYNEGLNRNHLLSFPWCVYDKLVQIKKDKYTNNLPTLLGRMNLSNYF